MAKSTLLHPQFFHTLVPGFHTHLMIPLDFFSKYIEGRIVEKKKTAELKSDSSDITWNVKMTGRRLSEGWEEFAVANNLQIGEVVLVKFEGDMVFRVSDLGSICCEIPPPRNGKTLLKKRLYPRTQVDFSSNDDDDDDDDDEEFQRKKKVRKNNPEAEAVSTSSPSDKSSFVALVTASSLRTDKLYLPQHVTSSNALNRKCRKIVLINGGGRSWTLDLSFNKLSDAFYMSRGWRNFCDENGQEAGGFFMFKLVANGDTPVLSFSSTESRDDRNQRDCSEASERESISTESPVLSFCSTECIDIRRQRDCSETSESESLSTELSSEEENTEGESSGDDCSSVESLMEIGKKKCSQKRRAVSYSSYSPCHKRFVTFTLPPDFGTLLRLSLPKPFVKENGINKPGEISLLGKDGTKWPTSLLLSKKGIMSLGKGWREFVKGNGLESGFTLKLIWEDTTPVFSLFCPESTSDREQEEYFKAIEKRSLLIDSSQKQFVTLTITPSCFVTCILTLPAQFARENSMNKPGMMIYLLGKDGRKWLTEIKQNKKKTGLGKGWKDFAKANNFKSGDSFRMELIWEDGTRMLRLFHTESSSSKANEKESVSTEPGSRDSSSAVQNRFVTLTLTPEDVRACMLILPSQFMKDNGINKLGKITILGENKMECSAYLLSRDGIVALEDGWDEFCEANGVKLGESFTLEFIIEQDRITPVLKFCSRETNK